MENSRWFEVAVHPITGEERRFQADTEEDLDRQITAWVTQVRPTSEEPRSPEPAPSTSEDPASSPPPTS